jgi:hypothetical protein
MLFTAVTVLILNRIDKFVDLKNVIHGPVLLEFDQCVVIYTFSKF